MKRHGVRKKTVTYWLVWTGCLLIAVMVLLPVVFTIFASFMSPEEVALNYGEMSLENGFTPLHFLPDRISLSAYREVLIETPRYLMQFWISLGICVAICVGQVFLSIDKRRRLCVCFLSGCHFLWRNRINGAAVSGHVGPQLHGNPGAGVT